jgi:anti-sigma-K factor RskA
MHDPCAQMQDDLAAHALGSLDPAAVPELEAHLAGCAGCRATLREYGAVARLLPLGLPAATPGPAERAALLAAIRAPAAPRAPAAAPARRAWRWRSRPAAWLGLALALAIVLVGAWLLGGLHPAGAERVTTLAGSAAAPGASGRLVVESGRAQARLYVTGLPPLPPDRSYQLWFARGAQPRFSGAVFRVDATGQATVVVDVPADTSAVQRVGVTEEPLGGSPGPTGRNVLGGAW